MTKTGDKGNTPKSAMASRQETFEKVHAIMYGQGSKSAAEALQKIAVQDAETDKCRRLFRGSFGRVFLLWLQVTAMLYLCGMLVRTTSSGYLMFFLAFAIVLGQITCDAIGIAAKALFKHLTCRDVIILADRARKEAMWVLNPTRDPEIEKTLNACIASMPASPTELRQPDDLQESGLSMSGVLHQHLIEVLHSAPARLQ